jgi:hypothetical protein
MAYFFRSKDKVVPVAHHGNAWGSRGKLYAFLNIILGADEW